MQKYITIYHDLVEKIRQKQWIKDEMLPSENELATMYETSRETIRKALDLLVQDGLIQKVRGKGSVITGLNILDFPVSGLVSFKELATKMNLETKTVVTDLTCMKADGGLQSKLEVNQNEWIWKVVRTREISGEKIILDIDYFNKKAVPELTKEICEESIYNYLENELGLTISFAKKEIVVEEPTDRDRQMMDLEGFSNVVVIKSKVYLDDASLFQYTESRHRPDKFKFVDFARRTHN